MKISASIYSTKNKALPEIITELDHHEVDFFHVDCNDELRVFDDISHINEHSPTPVDLHIISDDPEKYFAFIGSHKIARVSFQYENFKEQINFNLLHKLVRTTEIGLAITSSTPITAFEEYKNQCSYVLLMTTTPGKSGGVFDKTTFRRIREFQKQYPGKKIQVDGGVNAEVSFILRNLGVDSAVVGSYLFSKGYVGAALLNLKKDVVGSHFLLKDFMMENDELPILYENELSFEKALRKIEDYKMAFTLIVDPDQKLKGLISNADVRRGLLRNIHNLQNINPTEIINTHPLNMNENSTIHDLLLFIKQANFPLQYLPVVNNENQLTGSILFTNLIKGEL
jgi:pentose-5-phosphate-3-epimerase/CBS domain-containing protein